MLGRKTVSHIRTYWMASRYLEMSVFRMFVGVHTVCAINGPDALVLILCVVIFDTHGKGRRRYILNLLMREFFGGNDGQR
jgi:hypothetical protein